MFVITCINHIRKGRNSEQLSVEPRTARTATANCTNRNRTASVKSLLGRTAIHSRYHVKKYDCKYTFSQFYFHNRVNNCSRNLES